MGRLFGTQYQNAALRAVPPSSGAFSSRITSSPSQRANSADGSPPPPPPTTTTSAVASQPFGATGAADSLISTSSHGSRDAEQRLHHAAELRRGVLGHLIRPPGHVRVRAHQHAARLL